LCTGTWVLTGANPFAGETVSDSIGAVLHKELDLDHLSAQTPAGLRPGPSQAYR
jgi:hypothetical protein